MEDAKIIDLYFARSEAASARQMQPTAENYSAWQTGSYMMRRIPKNPSAIHT